jgi:hypothetical protein
MNRVTVKTSTIFIAKGGRTRVYRSVSEVPPQLRKELEESTNSFNSATILIADRRGRQEIIKTLNGVPSALRSRLAPSLAPRAAQEPAGENRITPVLRFVQRNWVELALPAAVSLIVWAAFHFR